MRLRKFTEVSWPDVVVLSAAALAATWLGISSLFIQASTATLIKIHVPVLLAICGASALWSP